MNIATLASILADAAAYAEETGMELTLARIKPEDVEIIESTVMSHSRTTMGIKLDPAYLMEHARAIHTGIEFYGYIVQVHTSLERARQYAGLYSA